VGILGEIVLPGIIPWILTLFVILLQTDDLSDEGKFQSSPEAILKGFKLSLRVLYQDDASNTRISFPYAAMFQE
jgi:hypothetical protein